MSTSWTTDLITALVAPAVGDVALDGSRLLVSGTAEDVTGRKRLAAGARKRDRHVAVVGVDQETDRVPSQWVIDASVVGACLTGDEPPGSNQGIS